MPETAVAETFDNLERVDLLGVNFSDLRHLSDMLLVETTTLGHSLVHELEQSEDIPFCENLGCVCQYNFDVSSRVDDVVKTFLDQLVNGTLWEPEKALLFLSQDHRQVFG